jgi:sec-independent protein translocase protein TatB|tara:strand:+ start:153 stop:410 length:258 start_codon:yes stop_codon:yes gene_type:complete
MPQIGWLELLIIVLISILIIGPKDFPIVLRKLGTWTNTVKKYFSDVQSNIKEITSLEEKVKQNPASKENKNSVLNKNKNINDKKD